jgi:hypothetical protein
VTRISFQLRRAGLYWVDFSLLLDIHFRCSCCVEAQEVNIRWISLFMEFLSIVFNSYYSLIVWAGIGLAWFLTHYKYLVEISKLKTEKKFLELQCKKIEQELAALSPERSISSKSEEIIHLPDQKQVDAYGKSLNREGLKSDADTKTETQKLPSDQTSEIALEPVHWWDRLRRRLSWIEGFLFLLGLFFVLLAYFATTKNFWGIVWLLGFYLLLSKTWEVRTTHKRLQYDVEKYKARIETHQQMLIQIQNSIDSSSE